MSYKHEAVDVKVSQRILWFNSEAYPLHNITRTNTMTLVPNKALAIKNYAVFVAVLLFVSAIVASLTPTGVRVLVIIATLAWIVLKMVRLVQFLNLTLYELVIETAAGSHRALVSDNSKVVADLAHRITSAINNPLAEFQMRVDNFHVGDNINMVGGQNVGKVVR